MTEKRQDIVETAFRLFAKNGFHATGIDKIIAESKTSKKTLYTHFKSKNDLVLAVLEYYQEKYFLDLRQKILKLDADAKTKLAKIFEVAYRWYRTREFSGCLAISAMNEFGNKDKRIAESCVSFKKEMRSLLLELIQDIGLKTPEKTADHLLIMLEGIAATAHIGSINPNPQDIRNLVDKVCLSEQ